MAKQVEHLLASLEECKQNFDAETARGVESLLLAIARQDILEPALLIRFHEELLFFRAFPPGARVLDVTEKLLNTFESRVAALQSRDEDLSSFDTFESAGIAGTTMQDTLSFDVARWLAKRIPEDVGIVWDEYEDERAMGNVWPRIMPLLEEDSDVEADIPWRRWLEAARGANPELPWLTQRFEASPLGACDKSELYDSLRLPLRWQLGNVPWSRTRNWQRPRSVFYHREPLITRREVDFATELAKPGPTLKKLSPREGASTVELIREVMLVRYRELYGTTLADPASVVSAEVGRGVVIYLWGLPPARRLPLRAYLAGFTLKNGVPINYIEAIGLCEWLEVGFNTFYTFRNGETAWIYAQVLRCLHRHSGATCFSVYPYQLGHDNPEAIDSGAYWFYRKLGFRPGRPDLLRLTRREERRIAAGKQYRTSPRTLKRLAEGHVFYELAGSEIGLWDSFSTRNIGLQVNRRMAAQFGGDKERMARWCVAATEKALGVRTKRWNTVEQQAFHDWALTLSLIPELASWTASEKRLLIQILRAKARPNEMEYLRLLQRHTRLRSAILALGSSSQAI